MPEEMRHTLTQCGTKYFVALTARIIMEFFYPYQWSRSSGLSNHSADCYGTVGSAEDCCLPTGSRFPLSVTKPDPPHHVRARCKKSSFPLIH